MITIEPVATKKELDEFVLYPWRIYKGDPYWVPPLIGETKRLFDRTRNPFFEHARGELFLARRNGQVVGRIMATVDQVHQEVYRDGTGFFGFFEAVNDDEVAGQLFDATRNWLKSQGMVAMRGPLNPTQNDECGLLLEGFDSAPIIMMSYNPRYFLDLFEHYGLKKIKDLYAYYIRSDQPTPAKLARLIDRLRTNKRVRIRPIDLKNLERDVKYIRTIYNEAWADNWGATPMTDREFDEMVQRLKPLVIPEMVPLAFFDDEPVGISLALPDYNVAVKPLDGRLGPVEMVRFLFLKRRMKDVRLVILGVRKAYRKLGIDGLLYWATFEEVRKRGYRGGEVSWILEDNLGIIRPIEMWGGKLYKKYRLYQMPI